MHMGMTKKLEIVGFLAKNVKRSPRQYLDTMPDLPASWELDVSLMFT